MTLLLFFLAVSTLAAYVLLKRRPPGINADAVMLATLAIASLTAFASDEQLLKAFALSVGLGAVATIVWMNLAPLFERREVVPATAAVAG